MERRILLFILSLSCFVLSCEKEPEIEIPSENTLYEVKFQATGFTQHTEDMNRAQSTLLKSTEQAGNAVQDYLSDLDYFVFDESGNLQARRSQEKEDALPPHTYYGEATFDLPLGVYKLIVVGSMGGITYGDSSQYSTAYLQPTGDYPSIIEDIFFKEITFTIDGEHDVYETVNLERIVGSLEVRLSEYVTDVWGAKPQVRFDSVIKYPFDSDQEPETEQYLLPHISGELEVWKTVDFVFRGYVLPARGGNFDINPEIFIRAVRSGFIAYKTFEEDIILEPNKKLVLSGSLTGKYLNQHFNITADSSWTATDLIEF